uniref:Uncharacterized protein n=1 Tax=Kalanchoe fedtschenkoi TaxID=63787 RepID=A0A7N0VLJ9_KALFE
MTPQYTNLYAQGTPMLIANFTFGHGAQLKTDGKYNGAYFIILLIFPNLLRSPPGYSFRQ